jgi:hypothetical protein
VDLSRTTTGMSTLAKVVQTLKVIQDHVRTVSITGPVSILYLKMEM